MPPFVSLKVFGGHGADVGALDGVSVGAVVGGTVGAVVGGTVGAAVGAVVGDTTTHILGQYFRTASPINSSLQKRTT